MRRENNRSKGRGDFNSNRNGNFDNQFGSRRPFNSGPRDMHKAKCSSCGSDCEVPFKPTEGKPVYCRNCFAKNKPQRH